MKPSFKWGAHCEFLVENYDRVILSVPALSEAIPFGEKELLLKGSGSTHGKATLTEHLAPLVDQNVIRGDTPLLIIGIRNNLVNLRAPIICGGRAYAVEGERPDQSARPYYGIGSHDGKLAVGQALGGSPEIWSDFFVSGTPVLWDETDQRSLLNLILAEAADHSHVFDLPRGNHPGATERTRQAWSHLHRTFSANVHADLPTVVSAMRSALDAIDPPPPRCDNYLNAVVGIRPDGAIVCIYAHGRLEALGLRAEALGCHRAVCVENSGSVMPTYLPNGLDGDQIPMLRAPNFRPRGRAMLIFELKNKVFSSYPVFKHTPL
jgi:hypothetical protein